MPLPSEENQSQYGHPNRENLYQFPELERLVLALAIVEHKYQGGNCQQVKQVNTYTQTHQEGYEHYPTVGMRLLCDVVPAGHCPEHHGCEKTRHGIHLALDGTEPEGIGEAIDQGAHKTGAYNGDCLAFSVFPVIATAHEPACKPDYRKIQEEDGKCTAESTHRVYRHSGSLPFSEESKETGEKLESGVSGRMSDFEFIRRCDELSAIPEGRRGLYSAEIDDRRHDERHQRAYQIPFPELLICHRI